MFLFWYWFFRNLRIMSHANFLKCNGQTMLPTIETLFYVIYKFACYSQNKDSMAVRTDFWQIFLALNRSDRRRAVGAQPLCGLCNLSSSVLLYCVTAAAYASRPKNQNWQTKRGWIVSNALLSLQSEFYCMFIRVVKKFHAFIRLMHKRKRSFLWMNVLSPLFNLCMVGF